MDAKELFKGITTLLKVDDICIDNVVFRLHYKATVMVLLAFAVVVTSKEYIGNPIKCDTYGKKVDTIDAYCWIFSTYTVKDKEPTVPGKKESSLPHHPGVKPGHYNASAPYQYADRIEFQKYYQWVGFILMFQAVLFYTPFYLWNLWEGGRLRSLVLPLSHPVVEMGDGNSSVNCGTVAPYIQALLLYWEHHLHYHDSYAFRYALCELLNMVNVVGQFYLLNTFLGGKFLAYGTALIGNADFSATEIMERVFPKLAKCTYYSYGPSGGIVNTDALCVLTVNVFNAKVFVIQWFWFMILSVLSGVTLLYRLACFCNRHLRVTLLRSCSRSISKCRVKAVLNVFNYGDWFLLYQMAKNMNTLIFTKLLCELSEKYGRHQV